MDSLALLAPLALVASLVAPPAVARADEATVGCTDAGGRVLTHAFDSGAAWSLCARIDERHGLELVDVAYRAPGDRDRPVLRSLHLGQLLLHWHDATAPERRIAGDTPESAGLGGTASVALDATRCRAETVALPDGRPLDDPDASDGGSADVARLCAREGASGLLAKYDERAALQGRHWELFAIARQGLLSWRTGVTLYEDGTIAPSVTMSGRVPRTSGDPRFAVSIGENAPVGAALLATWRLAFALDTAEPDRVEEFDFPLDPDRGNRRPMRVRPLANEAFRRVDRERFRGWRVVDAGSGAGYYLDPLDSAFAWTVAGADWARFDLALTRPAACERHAAGNATPGCGDGLDAFVDGESLAGEDPVLWHSRTRNWVPRAEDLPFVRGLVVDMRIVPFDWTDASPFEVEE